MSARVWSHRHFGRANCTSKWLKVGRGGPVQFLIFWRMYNCYLLATSPHICCRLRRNSRTELWARSVYCRRASLSTSVLLDRRSPPAGPKRRSAGTRKECGRCLGRRWSTVETACHADSQPLQETQVIVFISLENLSLFLHLPTLEDH